MARVAIVALLLAVVSTTAAQRDEGAFCRVITRPFVPPRLTRARLAELVEEARTSLPGCIDHEDLESATVSVRVAPDATVTVRARTAPHRDALAEACLAGNAHDRIVRLVAGHDVPGPVRARLRVERTEAR